MPSESEVRASASVRVGFLILIPLILAQVACKSVVLDERFHDPRLLNWTIIDEPDTVEGPSDWVVEDGWLRQKSNIWGPRGDYLGRWYGTLIVAGDPSWRNYQLSVVAKPLDDDGFGVVFRYTSEQNFYRLFFLKDRFNGGPLTRLDKREGEVYTELWSVLRDYEVGAEIRIEIEVKGPLIRASVEGARLFEIWDDRYDRGKIGLFCYAQAGQAFDDVRVVLK